MNRNNVNDNVFLKNTNNNVNDKYAKSRKVEIIADRLIDKLGLSSQSRDFMLKAAWKLSEARLWDNVEQAAKGKNPVGLFIYLCKRDGV